MVTLAAASPSSCKDLSLQPKKALKTSSPTVGLTREPLSSAGCRSTAEPFRYRRSTARIWREPFDATKHRDFMTGYQDVGGWPVSSPCDNLIEKWVYFVQVASFTFQFQSLEQIEEARDYFTKTVHPACRERLHDLEHYWQRWCFSSLIRSRSGISTTVPGTTGRSPFGLIEASENEHTKGKLAAANVIPSEHGNCALVTLGVRSDGAFGGVILCTRPSAYPVLHFHGYGGIPQFLRANAQPFHPCGRKFQ